MFKSVKINKASENIIEQIRNAVFEGKLKPGDKLPPEKKLMANFNVSKATLREAMLSLETLGFLEIRKGASGGAFVTEVDMKKARDCFANFLYFKNLSLNDLSEVRFMIEPYIAEKAALTVTEEDLNRLKEMLEKFENELKQEFFSPEQLNKQIEFHKIIAGSIGNPIVMFLLDFISNLLIDAKEIIRPGKDFYKRVLIDHTRIYKALLERDPIRTREEMIKHIREEEKALIKLQKEAVSEFMSQKVE